MHIASSQAKNQMSFRKQLFAIYFVWRHFFGCRIFYFQIENFRKFKRSSYIKKVVSADEIKNKKNQSQSVCLRFF